ncbi:MAG: hypothetical protein ACOVMO_09450 [Caulobacter sp.]|jgi:hypothetical protein
MIRVAILACALVALPSAALAQVRSSTPGETRVLRAQPAPGEGPPADYIGDIAPEVNGWIYQEVGGRAGPTTLYQGHGYPATITVCPRLAPVRLFLQGQGEVEAFNNRCTTVTTDHLRISAVGDGTDRNSGIGDGTNLRLRQIRYQILFVHRAAE